MSSIVLPRIIEIGGGTLSHLPSVLQNIGSKKPLIVTDHMMVKLGYLATLQSILRDAGIENDVYADTEPEPTAASIQAGIKKVQNEQFDAVIALGGGSSIDSAKAIAVIGKFGGTINEYRFPRQFNEQGLPIVAIPTTAGTGSECTRFTIITDEKTDEKLLCMGTSFMPVAAIIDYGLTISVPARTTADTGIDAMVHAIEAYVSRKANPYSDSQAIAAMRLIGPNLRRVYHDGNNKTARESMMLGSTLAGIAFSNASVALVHGMSRPIGAFFHVPHGLSNAMLLPAVTRFSLDAAKERYADCARALTFALPTDNDSVAGEKLLATLVDLNKELAVPTPQQFGIEKARFFAVLDIMAQQAEASGSPANNPRVPTAAEMVTIYKQLWNE
ncbi:iron-containing alcohol dehydrogenase [Xenorhabdus szentirmaii]|uniref:Iron-containing alcohol dehydrogenase n=2 Tax=Xenorhabdus szentirmaii TaxID=290112 RepID=W1ITW0_9GAMM|nr:MULTISPECIES: iron-containing alcohol dehydrogenase [Xenorhabdus]MBD2782416.1 iron-containing alcohol dehydrogenase [Xenorhabdus sp. 38]MBD2801935.1 iron-containing alcohol dehydrogenase [Xenorhabdus sp. M]MBD2822776.1 iron-containing alcohol dehydrogenase [Xenorhabdus sp. 42]MBD2826686.1 iron-containing alcohol dehydrogenase [Xenorhabdus sp. 5]PHM32637.1 bifunctional aldehyde/alcohol dehydrogenase [Xenorhabdus szentirmaii DSM 16338]